MGIKLHPKMTFCPGCPGKSLSISKAPQLTIPEEKPDTKTTSVVYKKPKQNTFNLF